MGLWWLRGGGGGGVEEFMVEFFDHSHTLFYSVLVSWFCDSWMNISILGANEK